MDITYLGGDSGNAILNAGRSLKIFSPPIHSAGFLINQLERALYPKTGRMGNSIAHAVNVT